MAWSLEGQLVESCSCNMFCPCWFAVPELMVMDRGWCAGMLAFQVQNGSSDDVDLTGRTVAITVHFPGPTLFDGNCTARLYFDEGGSDEQRAALEPIFKGEKGGPMEIIGGLVSNWLPTQSASIDMQGDGDKITVKVGGAGQLESNLLRDQEGNSFTLRGGGFVGGFGMEEAHLAPTASQWDDSDMPEGLETKSGARGEFSWSA